MAGAGHRAPAVTADRPRHDIPGTPVLTWVGWQYGAACRGTDLEVFFPGRGQSAEPARQICAQCPVCEPCLVYALRHGIVHGIWGGLTERDRRPLRSRYAAAARRELDAAIATAAAAGSAKAAIGRAFGLTATSVTRVLSRDADRRGGHEPDRT
jgi:WhiB family redox-sensing transcriptional regulator